MLRSVSVFLTSLGVLLFLIGSASAAFVGPDNTLVIGSKTVPQRAAGLAVRTNPAITRFVNIDLLVRAEAEGGVFLASSHRVDTESLLGGRRYFEITRMSLGDVGGVVTDGRRATRKRLRPARITGWIDQTTGDPEAELVVPLDGTRVDVVAVPNRARDRVTFTIGATVPGAFVIQVAVAWIGVAMIFASWVLRRFLRQSGAGGRGDAPPEDNPPDPPPGGAQPATGGGRRPSLSLPRYPRALESTASVATASPVADASADTTAPATVAAESAPAPPARHSPALPTPVFERPRWDKRKIALLALLVPVSLVLHGCAVPGEAPASNREATRTGMTLEEGRLLEPDATHVYAPEFESYPMWALIATDGPRRVRLVTRQRFAAPWRTESRARVRGPLPKTVERAIEPNAALVRRVDEAATAIAGWWPTGEIRGVKLDRRTRRVRASLLDSGVSASSIQVSDPPSGTPRVRMVEVAGGHVAVLRHTVTVPAPRRLTTVVFLPTAQRPRTLGSSLVEVS